MLLFCCLCLTEAQTWKYVDPRIGSVGVGRTFPGPSMPFGMVKPGPDCGVQPNAGWAPMPVAVTGFSQTHVSGTGGGQKYGNILIQPMVDEHQAQKRTQETVELGYYSTTFESGIRTEITTAERCAFYRFHFPQKGSLLVDASHYLGKSDIPDLREAQQFVNGEVEVTGLTEMVGYSTVRGGWNNGDAYTVYFALVADKPFDIEYIDKQHQKARLMLKDTCLNVRVGISFVSTMQARRNVVETSFDDQLATLRDTWQKHFDKVVLHGATDQQARMFYTGIYHSMLMPVDRSGENPKWSDLPYYDDYYAIWDTYRTSSPLLTLLAPQRQRDIILSLLNIYRREGFLPDARSGNCNGRTQGGSNAEVVLADACVKGLEGIDYELALDAMLHDATVPPGGNEEKEGRGGLHEYNTLGYIPYGIDRAGNRTIEYAYDDYCIALVAEALGREEIAREYRKKADNWKNLWRSDFTFDGMRGFILPKDAAGQWLDSVPWGKSRVFHPRIPYSPVTKVAPWYLPWWSTFFYEATSQEYSLSIPHNVPALIDSCGGPDAFRVRLDRFFQRRYFNVANEPSFLTPCLYHWIGRPDLSTARIHQIIRDGYSDAPDGLPGNDDSGAMSSWLAFHMMGFFPNAGQDYYLVNLPILREYELALPNGRRLHVRREGKGGAFGAAYLNGQRLENARITHAQLLQGGELVMKEIKASREVKAFAQLQPLTTNTKVDNGLAEMERPFLDASISYTLNRQFRTWPLKMSWVGDTLWVCCKATLYKIPRDVVERGQYFSWDNPQVDGTLHHTNGTFAFISQRALASLLDTGKMVYDDITWRTVGRDDSSVTVRADIDRTLMTISLKHPLPLVLQMTGNPLGIDWKINLE